MARLTLLYAGVSINAYTRGGGGSKSPDSVKSITGREILCKKYFFAIYFMCLMAYLGMFRKCQKVSGHNFDPKVVQTSRKRDPGS